MMYIKLEFSLILGNRRTGKNKMRNKKWCLETGKGNFQANFKYCFILLNIHSPLGSQAFYLEKTFLHYNHFHFTLF